MPARTNVINADFNPEEELSDAIVARQGLGYRGLFSRVGISLSISHLVNSHGELSGILTVRRDSRALFMGRFNCSSIATRKSTANYLNERSPYGGWQAVLETFCWHVLQLDAVGPEPETVGNRPRREKPPCLVDPIIPLNSATIIFGEGGSMKSTLAAAIGVSVQTGVEIIPGWVPVQGNVMILDWESGPDEWNDRIIRFATGLGIDPPAIQYRHCGHRLLDLAETLSVQIKQLDIAMVIVDSVGLAQGGSGDGADASEATLRLFSALRIMDTTSLLIDHVSKDEKQVNKTKKNPYGCYSADTDVLTREGWKPHPLVTLDDEVLGFSDGRYNWEHPSHLWRFPYHGKMLHISSKATDALVTDSHRLLLSPGWPTGTAQPWQFHDADSVPTADWRIAVSGTPPNGVDDQALTPWLRLIGWYISEGSCQGRTGVRLGQALGPLEDRMKATLEEVGLSYWRGVDERPGRQPLASLIVWGVPGLNEWLREQCGDGSRNKKIPDVCFTLSASQQRTLLEALIDGDGHRLPSGNSVYATSSAQLADDVQRLAILAGYSATKRMINDDGAWHVGIVDRRLSYIRPDRNFSWEQYDGEVFCLTVPSGAYVTRRNGRPAIHGNSIYKVNLARSVFELRREESPVHNDATQLALINTKVNDKADLGTYGLRMVHGESAILLQQCQLTAPDLEQHSGSLLQRLQRLLADGPLYEDDLCERLDLSKTALRKVINRPDTGIMRLPNGTLCLPVR